MITDESHKYWKDRCKISEEPMKHWSPILTKNQNFKLNANQKVNSFSLLGNWVLKTVVRNFDVGFKIFFFIFNIWILWRLVGSQFVLVKVVPVSCIMKLNLIENHWILLYGALVLSNTCLCVDSENNMNVAQGLKGKKCKWEAFEEEG